MTISVRPEGLVHSTSQGSTGPVPTMRSTRLVRTENSVTRAPGTEPGCRAASWVTVTILVPSGVISVLPTGPVLTPPGRTGANVTTGRLAFSRLPPPDLVSSSRTWVMPPDLVHIWKASVWPSDVQDRGAPSGLAFPAHSLLECAAPGQAHSRATPVARLISRISATCRDSAS